MLKLKTFTSAEFGEIDVIVKDDKEYFDAIQIAEVLGYTNPRDAIRRHCTYPCVVNHDRRVVTGKKSDGSDAYKFVDRKYITEGDLYRLIIKSKLSNAIKFEKWVMDEVLPSIRKYGAYMSEETINKSKEDNTFLLKLIEMLSIQGSKIKNLKEEFESVKPYIEVGKTIGDCDDAINIGSFAKMIYAVGANLGRNNLMAWFRDNGYIMKTIRGNEPKQIYLQQGLFTTRQFVKNTEDGQRVFITPYITGKGQIYFIKKIMGDVI
ncbi:hypothetical protein CHL78_009460 [Romboutsia weinsteinii]|uniref:Bro-N domain-containing protein n=1 Tax=Romboutsia weinsteinii TaxID=2020949 RepID=A0A371J3R4_9FIRM|nr:phage antirepressor KilAC domain-containing protein [Romboutsia weinsteinii]RDY27431.1 hypothetical protein CHL78_009460 [Romboutsia weinsteinii]